MKENWLILNVVLPQERLYIKMSKGSLADFLKNVDIHIKILKN